MIEASKIFEIRFYKDEYSKKPIAVCKPDYEEFANTIKKISKKQIPEKDLVSYYKKICSQSNSYLRWKLSNGIVVCISVKDNASEDEIAEYTNAGVISYSGELLKNVPQKRKYHKKSLEEKEEIAKKKAARRGKRGRPKGSGDKKVKVSKKTCRGKVGRPALSEAEKERRAKIKAAIRQRTGGKRGRPKGSKKKAASKRR